ncbi:MAG: ATP-binding protein [Clostridia bacterium]|nr:ATP-binding protein [Clostridia bacterium]
MKELSLHVLDIAQNSIKAEAAHLSIELWWEGTRLTITIRDDGCGMDADFLEAVTDPFTTTRTTRRVGMGLPLYKLAAEQTGGSFSIESRRGEGHGTTVTAVFCTDSIDCPPLGDMTGTILTLIQGNPALSLRYGESGGGREKRLDTDEMREILGELPLNEPAVLDWIKGFLNE